MPDLPPFQGWDTPHFTPIPDQLLDEWLPHLSEAELKVLLYIMRRTFGFKKNADAISLSQLRDGIQRRDGTRLDSGIGMAESSIIRGIKGLVGKGLIERYAPPRGPTGDQPTIYRLQLQGSSVMQAPLLHDARPGGVNLSAEGLAPQQTQESALQEPVQQEGSNGTDQPEDDIPAAVRAHRARLQAAGVPTLADVDAGRVPRRGVLPDGDRR